MRTFLFTAYYTIDAENEDEAQEKFANGIKEILENIIHKQQKTK